MAVYAYLRVSTDQQDVDSQKHGILEYANSHGFSGVIFFEDKVSGRKKWRERKLGQVIESEMSAGDTIIFAEVSRIARSTLQVLEFLEYCAEQEISVHIAKQKMAFDGSMQSRITATVLGMAAEIEREFISLRTKEALAARKARGEKLGRPKGSANKHSELDQHKELIKEYLGKGIPRATIAKIIDCTKNQIDYYVKNRM